MSKNNKYYINKKLSPSGGFWIPMFFLLFSMVIVSQYFTILT